MTDPSPPTNTVVLTAGAVQDIPGEPPIQFSIFWPHLLFKAAVKEFEGDAGSEANGPEERRQTLMHLLKKLDNGGNTYQMISFGAKI